MYCTVCEIRLPNRSSVIRHYANVHPTQDMFPCRVTPFIAEFLRAPNAVHECEKVRLERNRNRFVYKQFCYFCNMALSFEKYRWIRHMASHTGYSKYQSSKFLNHLAQIQFSEPFDKVKVVAFLCDLCNYVQFDKTDIEKHLKSEHGAEVKSKFKEVVFLGFPVNETCETAGKSNGEFVRYFNVCLVMSLNP